MSYITNYINKTKNMEESFNLSLFTKEEIKEFILEYSDSENPDNEKLEYLKDLVES